MNNETIEQKTYRILADLHKNTGAIPTLEDSLKDSIFLTVRDALELALAEEREANANEINRLRELIDIAYDHLLNCGYEEEGPTLMQLQAGTSRLPAAQKDEAPK